MFIYDSILITKYEVLELIISDNACSFKEVHLSLAASWWPLNDKTKFVWDKKEFFSQFPSPEYNSSHFFQENPRRNTGFTSMMSRKKIQVLASIRFLNGFSLQLYKLVDSKCRHLQVETCWILTKSRFKHSSSADSSMTICADFRICLYSQAAYLCINLFL